MADLSQMIRWNTGFIRGLAQSVLDRARVIRSGLVSYSAPVDAASTSTPTAKRKTATKKKTTKTRASTTRRRRG